MPVRPRRHLQRQHRITPEAVQAWRDALAVQDTRDAHWDDGCGLDEHGARRCDDCAAYSDAWRRLHQALGLKPWQTSPLDVDGGPGPQDDGTLWAESWPMVQQLRRELERACR